MRARLSSWLVAVCLFATGASAETLSLPDRLLDFRSPQGEALLLETPSLDGYFRVSTAFETQKNQAYCGVASMVIALNAMEVPAPTTPEYQPYTMFTQENVLTEKSETILPRAVLANQGMTLDQLGQILALYPVKVEVHHAAPGGLDEFRTLAGGFVKERHQVVLVNYLRKALGQERGGHISPLAAYDPKADRFLILDVARYKYPPVWVTASDLFDAMNTPDADNDNKTRGFVLVSNTAVTSAAP